MLRKPPNNLPFAMNWMLKTYWEEPRVSNSGQETHFLRNVATTECVLGDIPGT